MNTKTIRRFFCFALCLTMLFCFTSCKGNDSADGKDKTTSDAEQTTANTTTTTTTTTRSDIQSTDKLIALTFDDGPYSPVTDKILDTLEKNGARATFFVVGNRVATYADSVKRASELGCEIGSHSYSHQNFTKVSVSGMKSELDKAAVEIEKVTGSRPKVVRPPEGATNESVRSHIGFPMVMWSVDSLDWKNRDAQKDYEIVTQNVYDGCIVLMHDLYPATAEAVARFVPELTAKGYKFVTFSELMEARGIEVEAGTRYFSAKPKTQPSSASSAADA